MAAKPESAIASAVAGIRDPGSGVRDPTILAPCRTSNFGPRIPDPGSRIPDPVFLASASAPSPATTFPANATSCAPRMPAAGMSARSVSRQPAAAPAVLKAYSSAMRQAPMRRSCWTTWRISSVSVPPISSVIGASRPAASAARARYDEAESVYHPSAPRSYDEIAADRSPRCGRSADTASARRPMVSSKPPKTCSSDPGRAAWRVSAHLPTT